MSKAYVLYNPRAGNGQEVEMLKSILPDELIFSDLTECKDYMEEFKNLGEDDYIILCGGDGTLNRFVNRIKKEKLNNEVLYFPCGTGNDFALDLEHKTGDEPFSIKEYINRLPNVWVNGKRYHFLNAVGYGIDGYCCEEGERLRAKERKINYVSIAIKGLLYAYKPTGARVTVDGESHTYKRVWLAPTMYGRFYGGGLMPAPKQRRGDEKLSLMVMHDAGKFRTLLMFPSLFKGKHIKYKKKVDVFEGNDITVEFDRPTALQIDGETIKNVTSYTAKLGAVAYV